jgi:hypothetical protein
VPTTSSPMVATRRPVSTRLDWLVVLSFPSVLRFERGVGGLCKKEYQVYYGHSHYRGGSFLCENFHIFLGSRITILFTEKTWVPTKSSSTGHAQVSLKECRQVTIHQGKPPSILLRATQSASCGVRVHPIRDFSLSLINVTPKVYVLLNIPRPGHATMR